MTWGWVDTHAHFWAGDLVRRGWNPPAPLNRTHRPDEWVDDFQRWRMQGCVFVETGSSAPELQLLADWAAQYHAVLGFVAPLASDGSDTTSVLTRWLGVPGFCGLRSHFQAGHDGILRAPALQGSLREVAQTGTLFEFLVIAEQLPDVHRLCQSVPDLRVVVEHMGKPRIGAAVDPAWASSMRALAKDTSAVIKVSLSPRPDEFDALTRQPPAGFPLDAVRRHVDVLLESFGPDRLVWGSDWPVSRLTAPTAEVLVAWGQILEPIGPRLNQTARRLYRLPLPEKEDA